MSTYVSKVIYGNETIMDISSDTIVATALLSGYTAHDASGAPITGSCTFDANTKDATALVGEILYGKTAYKNGSKLTGTMPNIGKQTSFLTSASASVAIQQGYHDGSGTVALSTADKTALTSNNIREGVTILGIVGTMSGSEDVKATSTTVVPYTTSKTYNPNQFGDYNYFSQFTVDQIATSTTVNGGGGWTMTIGTVAPA